MRIWDPSHLRQSVDSCNIIVQMCGGVITAFDIAFHLWNISRTTDKTVWWCHCFYAFIMPVHSRLKRCTVFVFSLPSEQKSTKGVLVCSVVHVNMLMDFINLFLFRLQFWILVERPGTTAWWTACIGTETGSRPLIAGLSQWISMGVRYPFLIVWLVQRNARVSPFFIPLMP